MRGLECHVILVMVVLITTLVVSLVAVSCVKLDDCSCRFDDDGGVVSLRQLGQTNRTPLFLDELGIDNSFYSYNPCYAFDEGDCKNSAVCQRQSLNGTAVSLARSENVQFGYDGSQVHLTYFSDILPTQVDVTFECVVNLYPPELKVYGFRSATRQYELLLRSGCACRNACYTPPPAGSLLSAGSVLLIIFFVLVFLYIVLGTLHGKVIRGETGLKMLPNYDFWTGLPANMKEGCLCVVRCATCRSAPRKTYDEV